jgi:hypothetical protein
VGRAACPPQQDHGRVPGHPARLAGGRAPARLRPRPQPVEQLWANLKGNELANVAAEGLGEVIAAARQGIERIRAAWHLPYSFLRHCGLSVS